MNGVKTVGLMVALTLMLLFIGAFLGGKTGMTFALIISLGMNFVTYWFSDKIILRLYGARPVEEAEAPQLYEIVGWLAVEAQLPMPRICLIDQEQPNAFATGRDPEHGVVAVTSGIMTLLSREELEGVIAHELAHIKNRDILVGTVAAGIAGAISYLAQMAQWAMIFGGRREDEEGGGGSPISAFVMMIVGPIAAMMIQMAISRSREYGADAAGAMIAGNPLHLASALNKIHNVSRMVPMNASPATAHMFIVNPLSGGGLLRLFSTHPPVEERIARLESMSKGHYVASRS